MGLIRLHALLGRRREALRHYERLRESLSKAFGTEPEAATTRLQQEIWAGNFPPDDLELAGLPPGEVAPSPPAGAAGRHNLPLARTSFVGREREKLEVKRLLAMTRLLTLTGVAVGRRALPWKWPAISSVPTRTGCGLWISPRSLRKTLCRRRWPRP